MKLILASRSPRRIALLREAQIAVECQPADVDEVTAFEGSPRELAMHNAELKARAIAAENLDDLVLGADTIVVFEGEIFGKPDDLADARRMLSRMVGRTHEVITGVCLIGEGRVMRFAEATFVHFRKLDADAIDEYLATIDPLDKAGAYAAQDDEGRLIERIEGCFSNVVGLPVPRVVEALRTFGSGEPS